MVGLRLPAIVYLGLLHEVNMLQFGMPPIQIFGFMADMMAA